MSTKVICDLSGKELPGMYYTLEVKQAGGDFPDRYAIPKLDISGAMKERLRLFIEDLKSRNYPCTFDMGMDEAEGPSPAAAPDGSC